MQTYFILETGTAAGAATVREAPKRSEGVISAGERMGVKIHEWFFTLAPFDFIMKVEAPNGWQWELKSPPKDATCCVVQSGDVRYLRVAPRAGRATAEFEVRIHHPEVRGPEVKWTQPSSSNPVKFPF